MGWDGSGNIQRTNGTNSGTTVWQDDRDDGVNIRADRHDTHDEDLAGALENTVALDGQTTTQTDNSLLWYHGTNNRFEGFQVAASRIVGRKSTGDVGALTPSEGRTVLQVGDTVDPVDVTDGGTDAFSGDFGRDVADGETVRADFGSANTTTTPTLENTGGTPSGAITITTRDGSALWSNAISGVHSLQYDSASDTWLVLDLTDTLVPKPSNMASAYLQTTSDIHNGQPVSALRFIPRGDHAAIKDGTSTVDHRAELQSALDEGGKVLLPRGKVQAGGQLQITANNQGFIGEGRFRSRLEVNTGGNEAAIANSDGTVTRARPVFSGFRLDGDMDVDGIAILFAKAFQFGTYDHLWVVGPSSGAGKIEGVRLVSDDTTESTYNRFVKVDLNRVHHGFVVKEGSNSCWWDGCRVQPNDRAGTGDGWGFDFIGGTSVNQPNNCSVDRCSIEYPGNISNGIRVRENAMDIRGIGNRFESLDVALSLASLAIRANFPRFEQGLYGCNTDKQVGGSSHPTSVLASAVLDGTSAGAPIQGAPFNVDTVGKPATGQYEVDFLVPPDPNSDFSVSARNNAFRNVTYVPSSTSPHLTIYVQDEAGNSVDSFVSFSVHGH